MDSLSNEVQGIDLFKQLSQLWHEAGMHTRKWLLNSAVMLNGIRPADRTSEIDLKQLKEEFLPSTKMLGVFWQAAEDAFTFKVRPPDDYFSFTKRNFLSVVATLFYPFGFLAPFIVKAEALQQDLWTAGIDWDDPLGHPLVCRSCKWFEELSKLHQIYENGLGSSVIASAKARVAPLSAMSVPRLELMGNVIGIKLEVLKHSTKLSTVLVRQFRRTLVVT